MNIIGVVMGGGAGTRLQPLTKYRAKPAVPIAGKYRLVDIPLSNCLNSEIRRIYLLTQFNSVSLHHHVSSTFQFDQFHRGFVRVLAAQQTPDSESWYQGTADAVRQTLRYLTDEHPELIIILSGDQLYRMDFRPMIQAHLDSGADVSIATKPVPRGEAQALGIMQVDESRRIQRFAEKPGDTSMLDELVAPSSNGTPRFLASMGIYLFKTEVLRTLMEGVEGCDFGKDVIPMAIDRHAVFSYEFDGYWKDIGTIGSFWEANLALTEIQPEFSFYDRHAPVYTRMRYLPPSKINCCDLNRCLLSEGCIISGHRILHSVIGIRAVVGEGSVVEHSIIMGADFYEHERPASGVVPMGVGRDCFIRNAIIDKNARIGDGAYITPDGKPNETVTPMYTVRDGVIVIPKNTVIPAGARV